VSTAATVEPTASTPYWVEGGRAPGGRSRFLARISGLHCSLCTGTIEKAVGRLPGVHKVAVSLTHEQALVEFDPAVVTPNAILGTLRDIGYALYDPRKLRPYEEEEAALAREGKRLLAAIGVSLVTIAMLVQRGGVWLLLLDAVVALTLGTLAFLILRSGGLARAAVGTAALAAAVAAAMAAKGTGALTPAVPWIVAGFAIAVVFALAPHFLRMAFQSIRRGILNQHVLLEFGAFAGLIGGLAGLALDRPDYPTAPFFAVAVLIVNYHLFSEWLSLLVKTRSSQAVRRLLGLQPDTARVVRGDAEVDVDIGEVTVGDCVRIRPGERLPVDGRVVAGRSAVDESFVTGEPMPMDKTDGDRVIGGSINGLGTLLVRVTAAGAESFLQQVVRHVEDARALKPGILHLVDRILRIYTPAVLATSALSFTAWTLGSWWLGGHADVERGVFAALSVLVMGYPCAVGIAAPISIVRGAGEAADHGVLMRTGEAFQTLRLVRQIVLDKTGTLTVGRPVLGELVAVGDADELLAVAAAAEASSEHPLGRATLDAALDRGLRIPPAEAFEAVAGRGVAARVHGRPVFLGRAAYVEDRGVDVSPLRERVGQLEAAGQTVVVVGRDRDLLGAISFGDELRPDAVAAVAAMKDAGMVPVLVTGDNEGAARRVAAEVGIQEIHAGVLPGDKADVVRRLQRRGRVAMVGDGINDAPALMQADVGIAMGAGTDIAIESADIVIVGNRLRAVVTAREISRWSYGKTKQNVFLAFLFNGIGIPAAATGLVYPVWAMVAMAASVTSIFVNALWGRPSLFFDAVLSVGRGSAPAASPSPGAPPPTP
jgi:P-type Cu+ transporter